MHMFGMDIMGVCDGLRLQMNLKEWKVYARRALSMHLSPTVDTTALIIPRGKGLKIRLMAFEKQGAGEMD